MTSTRLDRIDRPVFQSGQVASLIGATSASLFKLRVDGAGNVAFKPPVGKSTRDALWSFADLVRISVIWQTKDFLGLRARRVLWKSLSDKHIDLCRSEVGGPPFVLLIRSQGNPENPYIAIMKGGSVDFGPNVPGGKVERPGGEIMVNLTATVFSLLAGVRGLIRAGLLDTDTLREQANAELARDPKKVLSDLRETLEAVEQLWAGGRLTPGQYAEMRDVLQEAIDAVPDAVAQIRGGPGKSGSRPQ